MRRLNLKIGPRIFLGFSIAALLTLLVALVSISYLRGVGQRLATVADEDRLLQTSALELRIAVAEESDGVRGYLLSGDETLLDPFVRGRSKFSTTATDLRSFIELEEDGRLLSEVEALHSTFLGIADEQVTLHNQGFPKAAIFLWQLQGNEVKSSLDSKLADFIARQDEMISAHTQKARNEQNQALAISLALVGMAWVVGVVGGIWISRSITAPLANLAKTATQIASGDLERAAQVGREDEIGLLAHAFNSMTSQLRNLIGGLEQRVADRTRELEKLEELGRAIINAPSDASTLPDVLREHVPIMFPNSQIEIRVFPDQTLFHHTDDRPPVVASAWEWLGTMSEAHHFLPGLSLPWDKQPTSRAVVAAPILDMESKEPLGGICLSLRRDPGAAASLMPAVQSLGAQIASALNSAKVYGQALAHERVAQELALAGQIQANFLPDELPDVRGWQLAAMLKPARETSGDFYDVISLPHGRLGILIADVTDKGMGAALYMALSRTLIRTYAVEYGTQPELVLSAANRRVLADARAGLFVTVFYGVLDPATGTLTYCNAGHNPPYFISAQSGNAVQELHRTGIPLGILDGASWTKGSVDLAPGDVLVLYTDGVTEAQNAQEAFFDEERLLEVVQTNLGNSAQSMQDALMAQVTTFVGNAPQSDDITLMVVVRGTNEAGQHA